MNSVNKVILVGNLGRDPELRYLPSQPAWAAPTSRALEQLERLAAGSRGTEVLRQLVSQLEPFFEALERLDSPHRDMSVDDMRALWSDRARLLELLGRIRQNYRPHVALQIASIRQRARAKLVCGAPCHTHRRSANHQRACQARYSLLRFAHFLPASAALVSLG